MFPPVALKAAHPVFLIAVLSLRLSYRSPDAFLNRLKRKKLLRGRRFRRAPMSRHQVLHRRLHAAFLVRDARGRQRHPRNSGRAESAALVDVAEVADAEVFTRI